MDVSACFIVMSVSMFVPATTAQSLTCDNRHRCSDIVGPPEFVSTVCPDNRQQTEQYNNCQGKACLVIRSNFEGHGSKVNVSCLTNEFDEKLKNLGVGQSLQVENCEQLNNPLIQTDYHFYLSGGMCCTNSTRHFEKFPNITFEESICACNKDYCNANLTIFRVDAELTTKAQPMVLPITHSSGSVKVLEQAKPLTVIIFIIFVFNVLGSVRV